MKLVEITEAKEKPGTYVGAKFSTATLARLKKFIDRHDIPNGLTKTDMHTTIIYSRKHVPDLDVAGKLKPRWVGKPEKLEVFKTRSGLNALVLRYSCPEQAAKHKHIMDSTDATYDFPKYKVHLTLSYDIGDYDTDKLKDMSLESIGDIIITELYEEELNLDWNAKATKKD